MLSRVSSSNLRGQTCSDKGGWTPFYNELWGLNLKWYWYLHFPVQGTLPNSFSSIQLTCYSTMTLIQIRYVCKGTASLYCWCGESEEETLFLIMELCSLVNRVRIHPRFVEWKWHLSNTVGQSKSCLHH